MNKDDGVEFFGGTVEVKHVLLTGIGDDSLDWTDGWRGKAQFVVAQQYDDASDNGIEADNNADDNEAMPRSQPTLANLTLIGSPDSEQSDMGLLLREGTAAKIYGAIVMGFNDACLDIDDVATFDNAFDAAGNLTGELVLENSILHCATPFKDDTAENGEPYSAEDFFNKNSGNQLQDPLLAAPYEKENPGFAPSAESPALSMTPGASDDFFTPVNFIGGIGPDDDWTQGWTTHDPN